MVTPTVLDETNGIVSFAGKTQAVIIDLESGYFSGAARVMAIGDSLTEGWVDAADPNEIPSERDGYRLDFFEQIIAGGNWIDFVGNESHGPATFIDKDHEGVGGKKLAEIVGTSGGASDFTGALNLHLPDVVLFMAGTNDFQDGGIDTLRNVYIPEITGNIAEAVNQFYAYAGSEDKYLVISTLSAKVRRDVPEEYAAFINEGYSIVGGELVVGDVGNNTYVMGIIATVAALQVAHPTLLLFDNPIDDIADLSLDLIHYSNYSYSRYATEMLAFLEAEIGLTGGTIGGVSTNVANVSEAIGSDAGDRINGNDDDNILRGGGGADFIEGGAGTDTLEGGTGSDVFTFGLDALEGSVDIVTDYSAADGDLINVGPIADALGWSDAEIAANVSVTDANGGAEVSVTTPDGTFVVAVLQNVVASDVTLLTTQFTESHEAPTAREGTSGDDIIYDDDSSFALFGFAGDDALFGGDGNDSFYGGSGRDVYFGGAGADDFFVVGEDYDGERKIIGDFSAAEGDRINLSEFGAFFGVSNEDLEAGFSTSETQNGDLRIRLDGFGDVFLIENITKAEFFANGTPITFEGGPPPDTGDDDGNMTLTVPDTLIDADENDAVVVTLAGLDADATAVVSVTVGGVTLDAAALADGDVVFDLTGQADGQVTTSVVATDGDGNSTTFVGPSFTLATAPDTSADVDGNLSITAPDTAIDVLEVGNVSFVVNGLDADATGVVTVSDGTNTVTSRALAADGTVVLDLSSLTDGSLDVTVTATDGAANSATDMTSITLDTTPLAPGDALIGTSGSDDLVDNSGTSTDIFGLGGDDDLFGGAGNDVLFGGTGRDKLYGGTGADDFVILGADVDGNRDDIFDFSVVEGDRLDLSDIGTFFGMTPEELDSNLTFRDTNGNLQVRVSTELGTTTIAMLRDIDSDTFFSDPNSLVLDPSSDTFIF